MDKQYSFLNVYYFSVIKQAKFIYFKYVTFKILCATLLQQIRVKTLFFLKRLPLKCCMNYSDVYAIGWRISQRFVLSEEKMYLKKIRENNKLLPLRSNYQIFLFMHIQVDVGGSLLSKTRKLVPDIISHSKIFLPFQHFLTPECRSTILYQPMLQNKMFRTATLHQNNFIGLYL